MWKVVAAINSSCKLYRSGAAGAAIKVQGVEYNDTETAAAISQSQGNKGMQMDPISDQDP